MVIDYSQTINKFTLLDAFPIPRIEDIVEKVAQHKVYSQIDLKSAYHQVPIAEDDKIYTAFEVNGELYQFNRLPFGVTNGVPAFQKFITTIINQEKLDATFAYLDDVTICGADEQEHNKNLQRFFDVAKKYNLTLNREKSIFNSKSIKLLGYEVTGGQYKPDADRLRPFLELPPPRNAKALQKVLGMFSHYAKWVNHFSDKIHPLVHSKDFPLSAEALGAFEELKKAIAKSAIHAIDPWEILTIETDASDVALAATLSQKGRPVAFFSRTLNSSEMNHSIIEKEASAVVESIRKWRHLLMGRHFQLITDQQSVSFMFQQRHTSKIKNEKVMRWRLELSAYSYDILYRPGRENVVADTLSRVCGAISSTEDLVKLHEALCHPGVTRFFHWIRARNMPFSVDDVRKVTSACRACAELKPKFFNPTNPSNLIKATRPFERLSMDYKGPLPTASGKPYLLVIVDEYSRFPFAVPCSDLTSSTLISHLKHLFSVFGMPSYIHTDRGATFMSRELKSFLHTNGIATSRTTPYNPQGNGQCERYNGILWKAIQLALRTNDLRTSRWEEVLQQALHSVRSLLCTTTNQTPHERMFNHPRKSPSGEALPTWLLEPGKVLLRRQVRTNKYEPLVDEVDLLEANPEYSHIRYPDGRESTVSTRHLAPAGDTPQTEEHEQKETTNLKRKVMGVQFSEGERESGDHQLILRTMM